MVARKIDKFERLPSTCIVLQPPLPQCDSIVFVPKQGSKTHEGEFCAHSIRRPWDAWEQRSLEKQVQESACQRSSGSSGYSQGPELLKAMENFKSRSHS